MIDRKTHVCPDRTRQFEIKDFYTDSGQCTYCGCLSIEKFLEYIDKGFSVKLDPENKIIYIPEANNMRICFNHLSNIEQGMISELYKIGKLKIMR